ncbi:unnamed protein product [Psylliodes chrysocephalus]|uniref:Major facilitator superfamily (MFS) profile domain-containing protein n=1 Tax=Psylliodes chrysocephalus TaxID=3402493 RepID=A0A9P0GEV5_9CUCU|nr:unnamed protein product [Psylliodes chrysocephala]
MAWYRKFTVEVPLFFSYVNFLMTGSIITNLVVYRTCYIILGYNKTDCIQLGTETNNVTKNLEKLVEPTADVINMVRTVLNSLVPIFICMMAGPWSDKHGRKPFLLITLIGTCLSPLLMVVFSYFDNVNPWYFLISLIPQIISGGTITYLAITLAYISDISTPETRGIRMAFFEATLAFGVLTGSVVSSYIFYATNYEFIFAIAAGCVLIGILYTVFVIPESLSSLERTLDDSNSSMDNPFKYITDMIGTTFKQRENNDRSLILLLSTALILFTFANNGDNFIQFIYLRKKLDWNLTKYTLYYGMTSFLWATGALTGTFLFHNKLKIKECNLALLGTLSIIGCFILQELAFNDLYIYLAGLARLFAGLVSPMLRALVSKMVPPHEVGKIFSVTMIGGAIFDLGASPLYTLVYNDTINTYSGIYNVISIFVVGLTALLIVIFKTLECSSGFQTLNNEELSNSQNDDEII